MRLPKLFSCPNSPNLLRYRRHTQRERRGGTVCCLDSFVIVTLRDILASTGTASMQRFDQR